MTENTQNLFSTAINAVEKTENVSHQSSISAQDYAEKIVNDMIYTQSTLPLPSVLKFLKQDILSSTFKLHIGGSFFNSFEANPLATMVSKVNKVYFGSNAAMIRGNAVHTGRELALRHKIETGKLLPLMECIRAMRAEIDKRWEFLNPSRLEAQTKAETFLEVARAFKLYYKTCLVNAEDVEVEVSYNVTFPVEIFTNEHNQQHFIGSGTFDGLGFRIVDNKEVWIMTDAKTSGTRISGSVEKNEKLILFESQQKELKIEITKAEKLIAKFVNAGDRVEEFETKLGKANAEHEDALANKKATTRIEARINKAEADLLKWNENLSTKTEAVGKLGQYTLELKEVAELIEPLMEIYLEDKAQADLEACIEKHQSQLAYYSILEYFKTGRRIDKLRVENLYMKKSKRGDKLYNVPELQIFEWDLSNDVLDETEEKVLTLIQSVEAVMSGVEPRVIFRPNPHTFYGSEFEELMDEVKDMVRGNLDC